MRGGKRQMCKHRCSLAEYLVLGRIETQYSQSNSQLYEALQGWISGKTVTDTMQSLKSRGLIVFHCIDGERSNRQRYRLSEAGQARLKAVELSMNKACDVPVD